MKFIGPPFTFGLQELSKNITIASPSAAIAVEDSCVLDGIRYILSFMQVVKLNNYHVL
jgi:hypothetical protein